MPLPIQMNEVEALRKAWGNKPCDHPSLYKEYFNGTATGDYVCTQCGLTGWDSNWNKKDKE